MIERVGSKRVLGGLEVTVGESAAVKSLKELLEKGSKLSAVDDIRLSADQARRF